MGEALARPAAKALGEIRRRLAGVRERWRFFAVAEGTLLWSGIAAAVVTVASCIELVFRPGDIIFGRRRVYQRKLAVADFNGICSAHAMVLRAKPEVAVPEFLPFFMQSDLFMDRAKEISVGSLSPTINWKTLAKQEFALPPPEEQRRIAEVLQACNQSSESIRGAALAAVSVEYALLRVTFGDAYGKHPSGFDLVALSDVAQIQTGLAKGRRPDASTTTRLYLRVANVKDGELDLEELKEIVVERNKIERYSLRCGDVLMTEGGDLDKLGRGTVWQEEVEGCLHQNHIFAVRTDPEQLDPWYLAAIARSAYGRSFFLRSAKRTSNLASVNKTQVSGFEIPIKPLREQRAWVQEYQSIRAVPDALGNRLTENLRLAKALLQAELTR